MLCFTAAPPAPPAPPPPPPPMPVNGHSSSPTAGAKKSSPPGMVTTYFYVILSPATHFTGGDGAQWPKIATKDCLIIIRICCLILLSIFTSLILSQEKFEGNFE